MTPKVITIKCKPLEWEFLKVCPACNTLDTHLAGCPYANITLMRREPLTPLPADYKLVELPMGLK